MEQVSSNPATIRGVTHYITADCNLSEKDVKTVESFPYPPTCVCATWIEESARQGVCIPTQKYQSTYPQPTSNGEPGIWELGAAGRDGAPRPRSRQQAPLPSSTLPC